MHLLDLGEVRVHKVAEQDLGIEFSARVCELDVRHAVDCTFFEDRESSPVIVDIGLKDTWWGFGR